MFVLVAVGSAACHHGAQAQLPAPVATLAMPAPPAHLLIPVDLPEPPPEPPVTADIPAPPPSPSRPRETATRPAAQPAAQPAVTPVPEAPPAPVLQTTTQTGPLEQKIAALLASAEMNLNNVNYRELSSGARGQYDQARSLIRMANDALKIKNYLYAEQLATKAAAVAGLLVRG
jgi:hypothetical protein